MKDKDEEIEQYLKEYKEITIIIDGLLEEGKYELIEMNLDKRQEIINLTQKIDREKVSKIYFEMKINELDLKVNKKIQVELSKIKKNIQEYRRTKTVNSMYSRNKAEKLNIFSKKV